MSKMLEGIKKINFKKYLVFLVYFFAIVIFAIVIDQVTKVIAMNFLTLGEPVTFIPHFIEFTLVFNKGAAFGMGDDALWIRIIFVLLSWIVAIGILIYVSHLMYKNKNINTFFGVCLALILGGDVGNLIDRTFYWTNPCGVIDFIDVTPLIPNFGIFNIADSFVVVGVIILLVSLIVDIFKGDDKKSSEKEELNKLK